VFAIKRFYTSLVTCACYMLSYLIILDPTYADLIAFWYFITLKREEIIPWKIHTLILAKFSASAFISQRKKHHRLYDIWVRTFWILVGLVKLHTTALAQHHVVLHETERVECHATFASEPHRPIWYFLWRRNMWSYVETSRYDGILTPRHWL
jgi:hypothetical protein